MAELKVSDVVSVIGKELYGDKFSIQEPKLFSTYKKVYSNFLGSDGRKKDKGLLIIGNIGIGKSAMMRVYQRLMKDSEMRFKWVNAYELKDLSEELTAGQIKEYYGYDLKCNLYIDDIGVAVDVKRYGNTINIISEIIMERYDLFVSSGFKTHLSSNILPNSDKDIPTIEKIYGKRVLSRIVEMCEFISWNGESLRK